MVEFGRYPVAMTKTMYVAGGNVALNSPEAFVSPFTPLPKETFAAGIGLPVSLLRTKT